VAHSQILQPQRSTLADLGTLARRIPFTLAMLVAILTVTAVTRTMMHPISHRLLDEWGFGLTDLRTGAFHTLFLAPFQVYRPYMVLSITTFVLLWVGTCEYVLGTWRAMLVSWTSLVAGYAGTYLLLWPLADARVAWALRMTHGPDVGASAMMFGAMGGAVPFLTRRFRRVAFWTVWAYLLIFLAFDRKVWDVNHMIAYSTGLLWGWFFLRRRGERWPMSMPRLRIGIRERPMVAAWLVVVVGLVSVLSSVIAPRYPLVHWMADAVPVAVRHGSRHLTLVLGFALLILGEGLSRGKRQAWMFTVAALSASVVLHAIKGPDWPESLLGAALLALLIAWRGSFDAPTDPPSLRQGYRALVLVVILLPLYSMVGFHLFRYHLAGGLTALVALRETGARFLFSGLATVEPVTRKGTWFLDSIPIVGWSGVLYALVMLLRGVVAPRRTHTDLEDARALLTGYGRAATSYMTLWEGNSLFFNERGTAYVGYRHVAEVALALGDPIGPDEDRPGTALAFGRFARSQGWDHAFYAAGPDLLPAYRDAGYRVLKVGEEAVIPLAGLEFKGKGWQDTRTAFNRAAREGVRFEMFDGGSVPRAILVQLQEISDKWLRGKKLPPIGFTLGGMKDLEDPNVAVTVAVDRGGRVHAFADWLPCYAARGWVIDLMRRREDAMKGVMEYLIAASLLAFKERGYRRASLAVAPLADLGQNKGGDESLLAGALRLVYEHGDTVYNFRSLFEYKNKFQPDWQGAYFVYESNTKLGRLAVAVVRAYLPGLGAREAAVMVEP
jgi:phosphatidylglycerol lysyltransferase